MVLCVLGHAMNYCADGWECFVFCGFGLVDVVGGLRNGVQLNYIVKFEFSIAHISIVKHKNAIPSDSSWYIPNPKD